MTNQELQLASVREVTGTAYGWPGDWHALFDLAGIPQGDFNGRLLAWINDYLSTSYAGLPEAMQAFAVDQGYINWSSMGTFDAAGEYAPINTVAPVVSGTPTVGQQLTTTDGTWDADPAVTGYTYQWYRAPSTAITGATNDTYTLVAADFEANIFCRVTATNDVGSTPADSNEVGPVAGFILDDLATSAGGAWSMARRLTVAFEGGPAQLRRVSDSDLLTAAFDEDGVTDTAAITTWIGGSSATARWLYDQVAAQDLGQATTGDQPAYNGSLQNARAGLSCADSGDRLAGTLSPAPSGAQSHCIVAVGKISANFTCLVFVGDGSSSSAIARASPTWWWGGAFALNNAVLGGTGDDTIHIFVKRYNGSTARLWVDGTEIAAVTPGTTTFALDNGTFGLNTYDGTNGAGSPQLLEAMWFPSDITDGDLALIHADLGAFYGITVP